MKGMEESVVGEWGGANAIFSHSCHEEGHWDPVNPHFGTFHFVHKLLTLVCERIRSNTSDRVLNNRSEMI